MRLLEEYAQQVSAASISSASYVDNEAGFIIILFSSGMVIYFKNYFKI